MSDEPNPESCSLQRAQGFTCPCDEHKNEIVNLREKLSAAQEVLFRAGEAAGHYVSGIKAEFAQARAEAAVMVEVLEEYARDNNWTSARIAGPLNYIADWWQQPGNGWTPARRALGSDLAAQGQLVLEVVKWARQAKEENEHGALGDVVAVDRGVATKLYRAVTALDTPKEPKHEEEMCDAEKELYEAGLEAAQEAGKEEGRSEA